MRCRSAIVLFGFPLVSACYTYAAVDPGALRAGDEVRVHLTPEGVRGLPELDGREGPTLDGAVADPGTERIALRVPTVVRREGFLQTTLGQNVVVPLAQIDRVETRRLSRSRTGLMALGTAGVAALVVFTIVDGSIFRDPPGPAGGSDFRPPALPGSAF